MCGIRMLATLVALTIIALCSSSEARPCQSSQTGSSTVHSASLRNVDQCPAPDFPDDTLKATFGLTAAWHMRHCTLECSLLLDDVQEALREEMMKWRVEGRTGRFGIQLPFLLDTPNRPLYRRGSPEFLSLQTEMEQWIRANRTVGMYPAAYIHTLERAAVFTNYSPLLQEHLRIDNRDADGSDTMSQSSSEDAFGRMWEKRARSHESHLRTVLQHMPWLLVSHNVLSEAMSFYRTHVARRTIIRVIAVDGNMLRASPSAIDDLLRFIQKMWETAQLRVEGEGRVRPPFLPLVNLKQLVGPMWSRSDIEKHAQLSSTASSRILKEVLHALHPYRHTPFARVLPTAVVYRYMAEADCPMCAVYGTAYDLLPLLYKHLCESGNHAIVSCSPLILFLSAPETRFFRTVPSFSLYARRSPSGNVWRWLTRESDGNTGDVDTMAESDASEDDATYHANSMPLGNAPFFEEQGKQARRAGAFDAIPVPHPNKRHPTVEDVLYTVIRELANAGSIQAHLLSKREIKDIHAHNRRLAHEANATDHTVSSKHGAQNSSSPDKARAAHPSGPSGKDNGTPTPSHRSSSSTPTRPRREEYRRLVTLDEYLRELVSMHYKHLFGSESIHLVRDKRNKPLRSSGSTETIINGNTYVRAATKSWWFLRDFWMQWKFLVAVVLYFILWRLQYAWNQRNGVSIW